MLNTPFSPWPSFTFEEADAVRDVLLSNKVNYWTGTECREFEKEFAAWAGARHAVALGNGTLALDVALKALGIGPGDEVITPGFTYNATAETVALLRAKPVYVDIDPRTYNLDPALLEAAITSRTKAIVPVSLYGQCADFDAINAIAEKYATEKDAAASLAQSIQNGSKGKWGRIPMPAHPSLSTAELKTLSTWVLTVKP